MEGHIYLDRGREDLEEMTFEWRPQAAELARWVELLATKHGDPSFISGARREPPFANCPLASIHMP